MNICQEIIRLFVLLVIVGLFGDNLYDNILPQNMRVISLRSYWIVSYGSGEKSLNERAWVLTRNNRSIVNERKLGNCTQMDFTRFPNAFLVIFYAASVPMLINFRHKSAIAKRARNISHFISNFLTD